MDSFRARLPACLRNDRGAIDLASVMVGVLVLGAISAVIAATVLAVIPWSQDKAAIAALSSVRLAESATRVDAGSFVDMAGLVASGRIEASGSVRVAVGNAGECYISASLSATGTTFFGNSKDAAVVSDEETVPAFPSCDAVVPVV